MDCQAENKTYRKNLPTNGSARILACRVCAFDARCRAGGATGTLEACAPVLCAFDARCRAGGAASTLVLFNFGGFASLP
jgi:hypothetical protein